MTGKKGKNFISKKVGAKHKKIEKTGTYTVTRRWNNEVAINYVMRKNKLNDLEKD